MEETWWIRIYVFPFNTETTRDTDESKCKMHEKKKILILPSCTHVYNEEWWPLKHLTSHAGHCRVSMNNEHHIHTHEWNRIAWNDMQNHISSTTPPPTTTACNAILLHISTHHISFITFHCHRCLRRHRHRRRHHHHHPQPHYHRTIKLVLPVISNKPLDTFWNPWIASIA